MNFLQSNQENIFSTRLSSRNQTVIPSHIRKAFKLKAGDKILWRLLKDNQRFQVIAEPKTKNWTDYTYGLGKKIWQDVDIDTYIKNLRSEWDDRQ